MNNEPILLVGFDALDMDIVRKAVSSGRMPTFKHLLESWRQAPTEAPPGVYVGAIWPSFSTCLNPGRHGRYCYEQLIPGTYESRRVYSHEIMEAPSFWHALSDAGKRTAIIDVPLQGTPRPINGLQVFQWGAHDPERPFYTHPPEWRENILSREGAYPVEARANATRTRPEEFAGLRDRLLKGIKLKTDLTARVMKEERWDLCVSIFSETHTAGHLLWHLHDTSHPLHSPELSEQVGDAMLDVYSACDRALGELIDKAKNSCRIMAFASHGMEAFYHLTFMLDPILNALETANRHTWQRRGLTAAAAVIRHGGSWVRRTGQPWLEEKIGNLARRYADIKPRAERAYFAIPNNKVWGGIRLNLVGREPGGLIGPSHKQRIEEQLIKDLFDLKDPVTGNPVVRNVVRSRDVFHGEFMNRLPDLLVEWSNERYTTSVWSPKAGMIHGAWNLPRTGNHTSRGVIFSQPLTGQFKTPCKPSSVMDIGPTICRALGVELQNVDGHIIEGLLC